MEKVKGYDEAKTLGENKKLPVGGYVVKIIDAKEEKYSWGNVLILGFDIVEGDYKGFYRANFDSQTTKDKKWKGTFRMNVGKGDGSEKDNFTIMIFKTNMEKIENSNENFSWDWNEKSLKGKIVGAIFNNKEYEINGKSGMFTNCYCFSEVDKIRAGKFTIPEDTKLKNKVKQTADLLGNFGDYEELDDTDNDLPF